MRGRDEARRATTAGKTPRCRRRRRWGGPRRTAPLKLVVSGSVLLGQPIPSQAQRCGYDGRGKDKGYADVPDDVMCPCSTDDWDCYRPAQQQLIQAVLASRPAAGFPTELFVQGAAGSDGGSCRLLRVLLAAHKATSRTLRRLSPGLPTAT